MEIDELLTAYKYEMFNEELMNLDMQSADKKGQPSGRATKSYIFFQFFQEFNWWNSENFSSIQQNLDKFFNKETPVESSTELN